MTNIPNINPANTNSLLGTFNQFERHLALSQENMLPARVIAVVGNKVQVQPMIQVVGTSGERISRAQIAEVPIVQIGGGGFVLNVPVKAEDLGFIFAADRDMSLFLQSLSETIPNTFRTHSFSDSIFVPSVLASYTVADANALTLQSLDGSVSISLTNDTITLTAPNVIIDSNLSVTGALDAQGGISCSGGGSNTAVMTGNFRVVGDITASGDITAHVP